MDRLRDLLFRVWALLNSRRMDREFLEEVSFHLDMEARDLVRKGIAPEEARRRAKIAFGGVDRFRERARGSRGASQLQDLGKDLQVTARHLWATRGESLVVVLSLGFGLGALAGVFAFFFGVALRPLPFPQEEQLVVLFETAPGFTRASPSFQDFQGWKEEARSFSGMGGWDRTSRTLTGSGDPEILDGARVSHQLFPILGVAPALGVGFDPRDDDPSAPPKVILSNGLWESRFSGNPGVLGASLTMDGVPHTVVGVMPPGFGFPEKAQFWIPLRTQAYPEGGSLSAVIARLSEDVDVARARRDLARVAAVMREAYPDANAQREIAVRPIREDFLWGLGTPARLFLMVGAFILFLSAANVTIMFLARSTMRRKEMAVRAALGASRARILGLSLLESLILAGVGGVLGVTLAWLGLKIYPSLLPQAVPYYLRYDLDAPVLGIMALVTLLTGLAVGTGPALQAIQGDPLGRLTGGGEGRRVSGSSGRRGWLGRINVRGGLVATQVGLAFAILSGTGLATRSLMALRGTETGIRPENVLTLGVNLSPAFRNDEARLRFAFDQIRDRVTSLPGVESAAFVSHLPLLGAANGRSLFPEESEVPPPGQEPWVITKQAQPGYFEAMGIPLVQGRDFTEEDGVSGTPPVIIVNQTFARRYWPDGQAIGKRAKYGRPDSDLPWMTVVGVAADVRHFGPGRPVELGIYEPFHQLPYWRETLVVKGAQDPMAFAPAIRAEIAAVDPNAPVYEIQTMDQVWYRTNWQLVLTSRLLWAFSAMALFLAALGVYGVVSFLTGQRRKEFAVRLAIGGSGRTVSAHAMRSIVAPVGVGLVGGTILAWGCARLWSNLLFGLEGLDLPVFALSVLAVAQTVGAAVLLPARQTARLDPAEVLRNE